MQVRDVRRGDFPSGFGMTTFRVVSRPKVKAACATCGTPYSTRKPRPGGLCFKCWFRQDQGRDIVVERVDGKVVVR